MTRPDDEEPTAEELREAAALARALERGHAAPKTPEDALETAALLRFSRDLGSLDPARADGLFDDAMGRMRPRYGAPSARFRFLGLLGLAATAAALAIATSRLRSPAEVAFALPPPPRSLLQAQVEAAGSRATKLDAVSRETAGYRVAVYAAMKERYDR